MELRLVIYRSMDTQAMIIEVSYQTTSETRDVDAHTKRIKYFETDDMPSREAVIDKLIADGVDLEQSTTVVKLYEGSAESLRKANIAVVRY